MDKMAQGNALQSTWPGNRGLSRRQFLTASARVAALSAFEWTPIVRVPAASAQSTLNPPPNFPSSIALYQQAFPNWSGEVVLEGARTCAPTSAEDVVTLANWAFPVGYEVRARQRVPQLLYDLRPVRSAITGDKSPHEPLRPRMNGSTPSAVAASGVLKCRGVAHSHKQAFGAEQSCGGLAPRLGTGTMDEVMALGGELRCGSFHVTNLEFDTCLRDGNVIRPFGGSETGTCRLREWPKPKVFCSFQLVCKPVFALSTLERNAQRLCVKGPRDVGISHDGRNARYEMDMHQPAPPQLSAGNSSVPSIPSKAIILRNECALVAALSGRERATGPTKKDCCRRVLEDLLVNHPRRECPGRINGQDVSS